MKINKLQLGTDQEITVHVEINYCNILCDRKVLQNGVPTWRRTSYCLDYEELKSLHNILETAMFMLEGREKREEQ